MAAAAVQVAGMWALGMLGAPHTAAGDGKVGTVLCWAPSDTGWDGNWKPLSQLPPFLTVLSTQRRVVLAWCLLALRKFSFVAA